MVMDLGPNFAVSAIAPSVTGILYACTGLDEFSDIRLIVILFVESRAKDPNVNDIVALIFFPPLLRGAEIFLLRVYLYLHRNEIQDYKYNSELISVSPPQTLHSKNLKLQNRPKPTSRVLTICPPPFEQLSAPPQPQAR